MFRQIQIEKFLKLSFILLAIWAAILLLFGVWLNAGMHSFMPDFSYLKYFSSTFLPILLFFSYSFLTYLGLKKKKNTAFIFGFSTTIPLLLNYLIHNILYYKVIIPTWNIRNTLGLFLIIILVLILWGLCYLSRTKNIKLMDYVWMVVLSAIFLLSLLFSTKF